MLVDGSRVGDLCSLAEHDAEVDDGELLRQGDEDGDHVYPDTHSNG